MFCIIFDTVFELLAGDWLIVIWRQTLG